MAIQTSQHYLYDAEDVRAFLIDVGNVNRSRFVVYYREGLASLGPLAKQIAAGGLQNSSVMAIGSDAEDGDTPDYGAFGYAALKEHHQKIVDLPDRARGSYRIGDRNRGETERGLYLKFPRGPAHMLFDPASGENSLENLYFGALSEQQKDSEHSDSLIICTFADRLRARIAAYWALSNSSRTIRSVAVLTAPPDALSPQMQVQHARLDFYVQDHHVEWHPYMNLPHFLSLGWTRFREAQEGSVAALAPLLGTLGPRILLDIGCGDGFLVKRLFDAVSCVDSAFGVDPALRKNEGAIGLTLEQAALEDISSEWLEKRDVDMELTVAMFLGNTLPHIGASKFSSWLRELEKRPMHLLIDFKVDWPDLLQLGEGEVHGWGRGERQVESLTLRTKRVSVAIAGHLRRRVHFQYLKISRDEDHAAGEFLEIPVAEHGFVIDQFADTKQDFFDVLNRAGYEIGAVKDQYSSGWGTHELYHCTRTDRPAEIRWPEPKPSIGRTLNELWYEELQSLWEGCGLDKETLPVLNAEWFPVAILPFDTGKVWGRYLSKGTTPSRDVAQVWLRMANREDETLPRLGMVKPVEDPVYAEEFHDALLAPVPLSVIRTLRERPAVLEHNELDEQFASRELKHLGAQKDTAYYTIPIYLHGLPSFLLIVPVTTSIDAPELIMSILLNGRAVVATNLMDALTPDRWFRFLQRVHAEATRDPSTRSQAEESIRNMVDTVEFRAPSDRRIWKSWLETLPGSKGLQGRKWQAFKDRHAVAYRRAVSEPYYQISIWLMEISFFEELGHENLTTKHQRKLSELCERWAGFKSPHHQFSLGRIDEMAQAQDAPDEDIPPAPKAGEYQRGNKSFQLFKALFCRGEANRGTTYRISPISVYAAAGVYFSKEFGDMRFSGNKLNEAFLYESSMAKPKLVHDDPWTLYRDLWETISMSDNFDVLDVDPVDEEFFRLTVRFENPTKVVLAGRGLGHWLDRLDSLLAEPVERGGNPIGYHLTFRGDDEEKVVIHHQWMLDDEADHES